MTEAQDSYLKGEPVPYKGTYRCTGCGETWTTEETGVRFPPCEANKSGESRWVLVSRAD